MRFYAEVRPGKYLAWSIQIIRGYWLADSLEHARGYDNPDQIREDFAEARTWYADFPRSYRIIGVHNGVLYRLTKVRSK